MGFYRLMVQNWSIFTLSTQLILCASVYNSNSDLLFPDDFEAPTRKEIFCNSHEQEKFLPDDGPGSSLLIDLNPGKTINSCKRFFSAPSPSGLFIRIIKSDTNKATTRALSSFNGNMHNTTEYCPISITPLGDEHQSPWRFDPCQMDVNAENDEPMKIFQGRVKVLWVHGSNRPGYKLSITVVSRNEACMDKSKHKHACLKFGDDPLLCISDDLICDGIRNCPIGGGMFSDEDEFLCKKHRFDNRDLTNISEKSSIWQHLTLGIFQNIFGPIESTSAISSMNPIPGHPDTEARPTLTTNLFNNLKREKVDERALNINHHQPNMKPQDNPELRFVKTPRRDQRNNTLSRYGSWGYMMLGMLMCSVLLLMCGIWECIRRVQKNDVLETFNNNPLENMSHEIDEDTNCPQYDPPPLYSSLFPFAKDFNLATNFNTPVPPSIYYTASSASFSSSASLAPASVDLSLIQNSVNESSSSPA